MTSKQAPPNQAPQGELELVSMYLPIDHIRGLSLRVGPEIKGIRQGTVIVDPNVCGLDVWGDRAGCSKMAERPVSVTITRTNATDPTGRGRVLHVIESREFPRQKAHLVEDPARGLWYGVYNHPQLHGLIVPLFRAPQS